MGAATVCDNNLCAKVGPAPPRGWIVLGTVDPAPSVLSMLTHGHTGPEDARAFCSWACAATFCYLMAVEVSLKVAEEAAQPEAGES